MPARLSFSPSRERPPGAGPRRLAALAVAVSVTLGGRARAQGTELASTAVAAPAPPSDDALRRAQRMLLQRAKERFEAGRGTGQDARQSLERALDALHLAYRLVPAPWLLFNMAQVQSRLGACNEAATLYRRFLASDPAPEARASTEQALGLLGGCEEARREPAQLEGLAPGLRVATSLDATFTPRDLAAAQGPSALALAPEPSHEGQSFAEVLPWAFGSLALVAGVAGAVYWSEARSAKRELDRLRVGGPHVAETQARGRNAQDLAQVFGGVSVGLALVTGASYLWLRAERDEAPWRAALEGLSWFPLAGGAGATYRSEF